MFLLHRAVAMDSSLYDRRFLGEPRASRTEKQRPEPLATAQQARGGLSEPARG